MRIVTFSRDSSQNFKFIIQASLFLDNVTEEMRNPMVPILSKSVQAFESYSHFSTAKWVYFSLAIKWEIGSKHGQTTAQPPPSYIHFHTNQMKFCHSLQPASYPCLERMTYARFDSANLPLFFTRLWPTRTSSHQHGFGHC